MNTDINLLPAEVDGIKRSVAHLIEGNDLHGAISLLEASIDFATTDFGGMRAMMFDSLFTIVSADTREQL